MHQVALQEMRAFVLLVEALIVRVVLSWGSAFGSIAGHVCFRHVWRGIHRACGQFSACYVELVFS